MSLSVVIFLITVICHCSDETFSNWLEWENSQRRLYFRIPVGHLFCLKLSVSHATAAEILISAETLTPLSMSRVAGEDYWEERGDSVSRVASEDYWEEQEQGVVWAEWAVRIIGRSKGVVWAEWLVRVKWEEQGGSVSRRACEDYWEEQGGCVSRVTGENWVRGTTVVWYAEYLLCTVHVCTCA